MSKDVVYTCRQTHTKTYRHTDRPVYRAIDTNLATELRLQSL